MPTYAYACTQCDNRFETVQSFTDDALTVCPQCQGRLRKVYDAVGVVFKGSGFYRTDSRAGASSGSSGSSDSAASTGSSESPSGASGPASSGSSSPSSSGSSSSSSSSGSGSSSGTAASSSSSSAS